MAQASLVFITGGVRSGKSSFAERKAIEIAKETGKQLIYLATGVPSDSEMIERIQKHQLDRRSGEYSWKTMEQSIRIGELAPQLHNQDIILLDCVTTLLNNELFSSECKWDGLFLDAVKEKIISGIMSINNRAGTLIVVSNELLFEPVSESNLVLMYSRILGQIHQYLVNEADQAFLVEAGIPIVMKGMSR
ncbi:bifunctional adenosylcobinamide kinase/adenosylcobinamide-phosphate guanylyltransferase [Neobacillus jeddahensis]|uniref:bifunctional adenosylcobinamide kinase/adenosylcobinamide-phosphate guanylyltransferase n=1 Tax=Neobacillus jeddahensis TaxID=1461580 RepID=UPI00058C91F4|nr:bifunctional adenosylcobinamide kinase/adenosylcobinamide-phosphate guanylyltransferase [Neobacillus jeddahensis]